MDAATPRVRDTAETHSHLVRPQTMDWQKTRFPGCEAKTLLLDRSTGLMTALMRFAPGAVLPDHEHVNIEQSYVLEGRLVDKEGAAKGTECKAGEFIWREAGSRRRIQLHRSRGRRRAARARGRGPRGVARGAPVRARPGAGHR